MESLMPSLSIKSNHLLALITNTRMESLMPSLLHLLLLVLLLPLSLSLIFFINKKRSHDSKNVVLPPGSKGWPILGENLELALFGFPKFVKTRMEKYCGNVFRTSMMGENVAVFCGAQGNKFVFTKLDGEKLLPPFLPQSLMRMIYADLHESSFAEAYALFHKFQNDVYRPKALRQHVPVMDSLAREQLDDGWRPNTVVKVLPWTKMFVFQLMCRLFLNVQAADRDGGELWEALSNMTSAFVSLPINLPGTVFYRAIEAGKVARAEMMRIVKERRKEVMRRRENENDSEEEEREGRDLLWKMLTLTDEDGQYVNMSDESVVNFLVGLLLASYETTAFTITFVMYFLAQLPHIYQGVFQEQMEIARSKGPDELLTWEDVEKMKYTWNVVCETLRLFPPAPGTFRRVTDECTYEGFTIPKGWKTFWTVHSSHKNPAYFPEPEKFDPSRFEGSGPAPYTFVPFGGGARMCPGRGLAKVAILVVIHNVVTRFKLEKAIASEKIVSRLSGFTPAHGLPLHLHPHQK